MENLIKCRNEANSLLGRLQSYIKECPRYDSVAVFRIIKQAAIIKNDIDALIAAKEERHG